MSEVQLEREFGVSPERLFEVITRRADLLKWWGHPDTDLTDENIDLSRPGPWHSVMMGRSTGQTFKMSGQVTHVDAPKSVGFTWGWHDNEDQRGPESHVTFTVVETAKGAKLIVDHRDLPSDDIAARHEQGWGATLGQLVAYLT
jgi:uncharacterized protein YndB with AHSA1/START domain